MATNPGNATRPLAYLLRGEAVTGLTDGELVAQFVVNPGRRGEVAFEALVARHGPLVWGVCRRTLMDPTDADDAFQATFLVLARRAGSVRVGDSLGRWLYGVSRRVAAKAQARRERLRRRERSATALDRATIPPDDPARTEVLAALDDAVARLAEPFRSAVVLCDLGGLTHEAAAIELGCPVGTVKSRLARGRDRLRTHLARHGFRPDDAPFGLPLLRPPVPPTLLGAAGRLAGSHRAVALAADLRRLAPLTQGVDRMLIASTASKWLVGLALGLGFTASGLTWALGQTPPTPPPVIPPTSPPPPVAPPTAPKPPAQPNPAATEITVEARDPTTDAPVAGVVVHLETKPVGQVEQATTDAAGTVRFQVRSPRQLETMSLGTGTASGFVPLAVPKWFDGSGPTLQIRTRFVFRVERGVAIGGRVVDPAGQPVAGASVVIKIAKKYPGANQYIDIDDPVVTDADGRWSMAHSPSQPDSIRIAAFHPLHRTDASSYQVEEVKDLAALTAGTMVTTLPERGTPLEGIVVNPTGQPVANAEVTLGGGYGYGNSIPPIRTDAAGRFQFGIKPGTKANLVATHPGFGPAGVKAEVGTAPQRVTLTLPPAATLNGQVVNPSGKPLARARVTLTWQPDKLDPTNYRAMPVGLEIQTDADGRFAWPEAPPGAVQAEVYASGYTQRQGVALTTGAANVITLARPTKVRGTIVDAATGQPIPDFRLTPGAVWNLGERLIWQRDDLFPVTRTGPGTFEITSEMSINALALRIGSDDHCTETSPTIPMDGASHDVTLRLTRGEPIVGRVLWSDGSPVVGMTVYLDHPDDSHRMADGAISSSEAGRMTHVPVAADGSFRLPPQRAPFSLIVLGDAGVALLPVSQFRSGQTVTVQPWASVSGVCKLAEAPGEGFYLARDQRDPSRSAAAGYPTEEQIWVKVDPSGRFTIPRLTPGRHVLGRWVNNNADRRQWFQALAVVHLKPGEAATLDISITGRPVTGQLRLPPLAPNLAPMIRLAQVEPVAPADLDRERGVQLNPAGRFRIENLAPGQYLLRLSVHEPPPDDACGWGRLLGRFEHPFTVTGTATDGVLDLGTIEPVETPAVALKVGELAPPFTATTLDGKPLALADLKGNVTLIDFWATWCAPCVAELPAIKAIHAEFAADPRFRVVSLSLDENEADLRRYATADKLDWPQALVGPESPIVAAYGATAIPATFLVGPDGRIIARDLRGDALRRTIREALVSR